MKLRHLVLVLLCWIAVVVTTSGQGVSAQEALEAARKTAVVDGDLAAAIKQYEAIVARYEKSDRAAAAQALLRMAECYEKQRNAEAQRVYERVIKEYPDQLASVATAVGRRRLQELPGSAASSAGIVRETSRPVWTLPEDAAILGPVSADGRHLAFRDTGSVLYVRDLITGSDRLVLPPGGDQDRWTPDAAALSSDGRKLAYRARARTDPTEGNSSWKFQLRVVDDVLNPQRSP
jgi:tetratricopeptide (TPR) repeat protein